MLKVRFEKNIDDLRAGPVLRLLEVEDIILKGFSKVFSRSDSCL